MAVIPGLAKSQRAKRAKVGEPKEEHSFTTSGHYKSTSKTVYLKLDSTDKEEEDKRNKKNYNHQATTIKESLPDAIKQTENLEGPFKLKPIHQQEEADQHQAKMIREILEILKNDKRKLSTDEADVLDMFIASLYPLYDFTVRDSAPPARLRVLNKEPKRHHNHPEVEEEKADLKSVEQPAQNWEHVVKDKAKMIEMHAF